MTALDAILSLLPPLLLWASFGALLCIRNWLASRAPAAQKAQTLIRQWLSPAQLHEYEKRERFEVTGSAGGRYLITPGYIRDLNTGEHICFVPENWSVLPAADIMLARKVALENDEASALKVAYRLPY